VAGTVAGMAGTKRLTAISISTLGVGTHTDRTVPGLILQVTPHGRSWIYRFQLDGRRREMGLGSVKDVTLAMARQKAAEARLNVMRGHDPVEARRAEKSLQRAAEARKVTFKDAALDYIARHEGGWRSTHHRDQWVRSLEQYAYPTIGELTVDQVDRDHVLKVLEKIWTEKTETANRVRNRIELVLDAAAARGLRDESNPARWKALRHLLPTRQKIQPTAHHSALAIDEMPMLMAALRQEKGVTPLALQFAILTAARTTEVRGARWSEIDLAAKVWTVAGQRMKAGREHRVPLSRQAMAILRTMAVSAGHKSGDVSRSGDDALVFPGQRADRMLGAMSILAVLRRMEISTTVHGFRSTFRDWCAESGRPHELAEMALAHTIKNKAEAAYRRLDQLELRRQLMQSWADHCDGYLQPSLKIVSSR
jgi:integrase